MSVSKATRSAFLCLVGVSAGGIISAGVFAFLAIIGVYPRLIGRTRTKGHILLYETMIIIGGAFGNILDIFEFPVRFGGSAALAVFGAASGIFVGCLAMSLAETLKAIPVIIHRIRLSVGLQYVVAVLALGKMLGSLVYFYKDMGA